MYECFVNIKIKNKIALRRKQCRFVKRKKMNHAHALWEFALSFICCLDNEKIGSTLYYTPNSLVGLVDSLYRGSGFESWVG